MENYLVIDPGKDKCGLILADIDNFRVIDGKIARASSVLDLISLWTTKYTVDLVLLGNGTGSKYWHSQILSIRTPPVQFVEEYGTTLRAKLRYFEMFPPGTLAKFIPKGMLLAPKNLDALAALVLLEDYCSRKFAWSGEISFKIWP